MLNCVHRGHLVPDGAVAEMPDSSKLLDDPPALRRRLAHDGFVFLPDVLPRDRVLAARLAVLRRLQKVGEVAEPVEEALWTGTSQRAAREADLGVFWQSVSEEPVLRRLTHGPELLAIVEIMLGEPTVAHDMLYLRAGVRGEGRSTDLHYDYPFFARTTERTITAWIPLGEVPSTLGPLVVIEGSNSFADLVEAAKAPDAGSAGSQAALADDMVAFARHRGARLLTKDFKAGDAVLLSMTILHGSLDNHAQNGAIRLSFDLRFQPATAPRDMRFFGHPPPGLTGRGYGELNGAKPLIERWHQR